MRVDFGGVAYYIAAVSTLPEPPVQFSRLRKHLYVIIFGAATPAGKAFDIALIGLIIMSVVAVMLDSVAVYRLAYGDWLLAAEWIFTILFTLEYVVRLYCTPQPLRYARSFYGIVDLLAIIPTYLSVLMPGAQYLLVVRLLRVLRVFRVLKIVQYMGEAEMLIEALRNSRRKISVFIFAVLTLIVVFGSIMYMVEGAKHGFTSIPRSIYWTIVTITTVGYGDISPETPVGQFLASIIMMVGYAIIAVPTSIVSVEMAHAARGQKPVLPEQCPECHGSVDDVNARFCKYCGERLSGAKKV